MIVHRRPRPRTRSLAAIAALGVAGVLGLAQPAGAHTEADVIAVPAGEQVTIHLSPEHGCGDSPTVDVAIRAPLAGATAGEVDGWTATATADGSGRTVLEWTGGSLPADEEGEFPVTFTAPDQVGELLLFPAVQTCENGDELAWISGDPEAEYPAPRLLILPAGSEPASSIDDVPPEAPGRDQLTAVVEVEAATTTTAAPTTVAPTTPGETTAAPTTAPEAASDVASDEDDGGDSGPNAVVLAVVAIVVVAAGGGFLAWRQRRVS